MGGVDGPGHPLRDALLDAAEGRFPPRGSPVRIVLPPPHLAGAVVAFSGCTFIAADVDPRAVESRLGPDPLVGPVMPRFLEWLAAQTGGEAQNHEVVLAAIGTGADDTGLRPDPDWRSHERARHGARLRRELCGWKHDHGIVLVGRGLFDRWEVAYEISPSAPAGAGRVLARAALGAVPVGEPLFAQIAPGHAQSLRTALAAGYEPIAGEVLITR